MNLIRTESISYAFGSGHYAIRNVSLSINRGEFIVLAGKNGSGKTVLAKHLNGLLLPNTGSLLYRGRPYEEDIMTIRQKVGLVFQNPVHQFIGQTVEEDVAFGPENLGLPEEVVRHRVQEALSVAGLEEVRTRHPYSLSGGEQRRLAIAGVLAMEPEIIILDEPFSGLDYPGVRSVLEKIIELHKTERTVIVITHDVEKILAHAGRLIVMDRGEVALDDSPKNIYDRIASFDIRCTCRNTDELEKLTWIS
jgi:biotin transport system ATP-binding protein